MTKYLLGNGYLGNTHRQLPIDTVLLIHYFQYQNYIAVSLYISLTENSWYITVVFLLSSYNAGHSLSMMVKGGDYTTLVTHILPLQTFHQVFFTTSKTENHLFIIPVGVMLYPLTHWPLRDVAVILKVWISNSLYRIIAWALAVKLLSCECCRTLLMKSQHWFS